MVIYILESPICFFDPTRASGITQIDTYVQLSVISSMLTRASATQRDGRLRRDNTCMTYPLTQKSYAHDMGLHACLGVLKGRRQW